MCKKSSKEVEKQTEKSDPSKTDPTKVASISYFTLFRFATGGDKIYVVIALLAAFGAGVIYPYGIWLIATVIQHMLDYEKGVISGDDLTTYIRKFALHLCSVAIFTGFAIYLSNSFMNVAAINQIFRIRTEYLKAVLNQDFSYFDTRQIGDFASKMSENVIKVEEGIGDKLGTAVFYASAGVACVTMALYKGWKLALLCLISSPISFLLVVFIGKFAQHLSKKEAEESGRASAVAEEVVSSIRTVYAFNGQKKEIERYKVPLAKARKIDIKKEFFTGLAMSMLFVCIFSSYGLSFYFGIYLIVNDPMNYNAAVMFAVFIGVITGMQFLGFLGTLVTSFGSARGAGAHIFSVIDNKPKVNPLAARGARPQTVEGNIEFKNVVFRYPSRPDTPVLNGLSLSVKRGHAVALVGASGCGKSTTIQLIGRYYDVLSGKVLFDGHDVRDLSVQWLREQIGLVQQEPVLFNTTVRENIRYGREGASDTDIEAVARQANAHSFIRKLPQGYDTLVGERGASLSGGQKQRIAIARALLRNPPVLLLDEATSALDTSSEAKVQSALDKASAGRTTLIVAHRLSTIRNVDVIYVISEGQVIEKGSHQELMRIQGHYYRMLLLQQPLAATESDVTKETKKREDDAVSIDSDEGVENENVQTAKESEPSKPPKMSFRQLMKLNAPEWKSVTVGCISSIITGFSMPLFFLVFGHLIGLMSEPDTSKMMEMVSTVSLHCVSIGLVVGASNLIEALSFGIAGAYLTERLRYLMFAHILRQAIEYFDSQENSTGALCARLSSEAAYVRSATGQRVGTVLQAVGSIGLAVTLALIYEWRLALVAVGFMPILVVLVYYQTQISMEESFGAAEAVEKSTKIAFEAVANVRTVAALGRERRFLDEYVAVLRPVLGIAHRSAHCRGVVAGASRSLINFINATSLSVGAHLIVSGQSKCQNVIIATQVLNMASNMAQNVFTYYREFQKGMSGAARAQALLEKQPTMTDPPFSVPNFLCTGEAKFEAVEFRYPTRPGAKILRGLDLEIRGGATLALVGESGCGKSTVISLLQRYYDPEAGVVTLSDIPLPRLLFEEIRACLGLVSQEPVLFDRTVGENIAYGDNSRTVSDQEIEEAAVQANIHTFIKTLPLGYSTNIGAKGVQLSGGQKQRIAIARALVRKPKILLLDEATSALDTESEKVVQEALDRAKQGRTCLMIAHRLSTVRGADAICVVQRGRVAELGTHAQLLENKGLYYDLYRKGS